MIPIIYPVRVNIVGGLWSSKLGGEFQDGDPNRSSHIIQGRADIKELGQNLRLFFNEVKIRQRRIILTNDDKLAIANKYMEDKRDEHIRNTTDFGRKKDSHPTDSNGENNIDNNVNTDPNNTGIVKSEGNIHVDLTSADELVIEDLIQQATNRMVPLPKLTIYLSQKKPKIRMIDIHRNGYRVKLPLTAINMTDGDDNDDDMTIDYESFPSKNLNTTECYFGQNYAINNFEASLPNIKDIYNYYGLVIVKLPDHEPVTSEPIVYGFIKLESSRTAKVNTGASLHLTHIADRLFKNLALQDHHVTNQLSTSMIKGKIITPGAAANMTQRQNLLQRSDSIAIKSRKGQAQQVTDYLTEIHKQTTQSNLIENRSKLFNYVKPLRYYRQIATDAYSYFQKNNDDLIDIHMVYNMLDYSNIFLVYTQINRIFFVLDTARNGLITESEFENVLIAIDVLDSYSKHIDLLDVYDAFKMTGPVNDQNITEAGR